MKPAKPPMSIRVQAAHLAQLGASNEWGTGFTYPHRDVFWVPLQEDESGGPAWDLAQRAVRAAGKLQPDLSPSERWALAESLLRTGWLP